MKNLILSVTFTVICCTAFAQNKKADTSKKGADIALNRPQLVQEKIWPLNDPKNKSKDSIIIRPRPAARTRIRL